MTPGARYSLTLPGRFGAHAPPTVVIVHFTGRWSLSGAPLYADPTGTVQAEIADGLARLLGTDGPGGRHVCLIATPL